MTANSADAGADAGAGAAPSPRWLTPLLCAVTVLALAPSLAGGWLDYDDGWLVRDNPILGSSSVAAVASIFVEFSRETRLVLGAEYLPVRDVFVWLTYGVLGAPVWALHAFAIALYVVGVLLVRRWLHVAFGPSAAIELAAWLFALSPVHVEAVAWLASIKDMLLLVFTGGALVLWTSQSPRHRSIAVALAFVACFAKSAGVVIPGLFLVSDLVMKRRLDTPRIIVAIVLAAIAAAIHAHVGTVVGMFAEPIGGSRVTTASSMLVVIVRYAALASGVGAHSIVYEVEALEPLEPRVLASALGLVVLVSAAIVAFRRGLRWPLAAVLLFAIPLLPVSQVIAPLQNRMADRYLLLAALGPCLAIAHLAVAGTVRLGERVRRLLTGGLVAVAAMLVFVRALTFSSPIVLFVEAMERTTLNPVPPYQLAIALEAASRDEDAELAYQAAVRRDGLRTETGRRAGNNLGRLLARRGNLIEAVALYRDLHASYPEDPRVLRNLAEVVAGMGDAEEAARLNDDLQRRFPDYERTRLERHVGP